MNERIREFLVRELSKASSDALKLRDDINPLGSKVLEGIVGAITRCVMRASDELKPVEMNMLDNMLDRITCLEGAVELLRITPAPSPLPSAPVGEWAKKMPRPHPTSLAAKRFREIIHENNQLRKRNEKLSKSVKHLAASKCEVKGCDDCGGVLNEKGQCAACIAKRYMELGQIDLSVRILGVIPRIHADGASSTNLRFKCNGIADRLSVDGTFRFASCRCGERVRMTTCQSDQIKRLLADDEARAISGDPG